MGAPLTPTLAGGEGRQRLYAAAIRPVGAFARTLRSKRTHTRGIRCHPQRSRQPPLLLSLLSNRIARTEEKGRPRRTSENCRVRRQKLTDRKRNFNIVLLPLVTLSASLLKKTAVKSSGSPRCTRTYGTIRATKTERSVTRELSDA